MREADEFIQDKSEANPTPPAPPEEIGLLRRMWFFFLGHQVTIALGSFLWLLWRSGTQPRRLVYPCQQIAAANVGSWALVILPSALVDRHCRRHSYHHPRSRQFARSARIVGRTVFGVALCFSLFWVGVEAYEYARNALDPKIPSILADVPMQNPAGVRSSRMLSLSDQEAVVAFRRDPNQANYPIPAYCPVEDMPYDPAVNPAYDLVWRTVADLRFGPADNPLRDLITPGDKVLLKPNVVQERAYDCPPPAFVRPIVDMCALAGAAEIIIADGNREPTFLIFDAQGYTQAYIDALDALWPGVAISRADLHDRGDWRWVTLGGDSAYEGSSYTDIHSNRYDDVCSGYGPTQRDLYFGTPDQPRGDTAGVENTGNIIRWWAVNNLLFDADVVINIPKMKVHMMNVNTIALKNWVGATLISTYPVSYYGQNHVRITHHRRNPAATLYEKSGFGNDLMWRDLGDLHRATLYWQGHGQELSGTPLRKYLVISDGIWGGESNGSFGYVGYFQGAVTASVDPVAHDCTGSRLMAFHWRPTEVDPGEWRGGIPAIHNQQFVSPGYPLGTSDAARIRVVGDEINRQVNRAGENYEYRYHDIYDPSRTWPDWELNRMNDLHPPLVWNVTLLDQEDQSEVIVELDDDDAVAVYAYYGSDSAADGAPFCLGLTAGAKNTWTGLLPADTGELTVVAQDANLNTASWSNGAAVDGFEYNVLESSFVGDVQDQKTGHGSWFPDPANPLEHAGWNRIPESHNPDCAVEIVEDEAFASDGRRFLRSWGTSGDGPWMWRGFDLAADLYHYQVDLHFSDINLFRIVLMNGTANPVEHRGPVEIWFEGWNEDVGHEHNFPCTAAQDGEIWVNDNGVWSHVGYWKGPQAVGGDAEQGWVRLELRHLTAPGGPDSPGGFELIWGGVSLGTFSTWWDPAWTSGEPIYNMLYFEGGVVNQPAEDTKGVFLDDLRIAPQRVLAEAPEIMEVTPSTGLAHKGVEYIHQLTLLRGTEPVSWSLLQAPPSAEIDEYGQVGGWIPVSDDVGQIFDFEAEARNIYGTDRTSWQVFVTVRADFDGDGDVDLEDFGYFQACLSGPGVPYTPGCQNADLDGDGEVDNHDFMIFKSYFSGANRLPQ